MIFGAGIGGKPDEFTRFGDPGDDRLRAAMLDEGLELVDALLAGRGSTIGASTTSPTA